MGLLKVFVSERKTYEKKIRTRNVVNVIEEFWGPIL